jgi:hypothetical protein
MRYIFYGEYKMLEDNLTILQMNDSHAYMDMHQELFWDGDGILSFL